MNKFTDEEIKAAQATRDAIIRENVPEVKAVYMAGEICMHQELRPMIDTLNNDVVKYGMHLPDCYKMQNWSEALDAFAHTPEKFRDAGYHQAVEEMNRKMATCSCGFQKYIK